MLEFDFWKALLRILIFLPLVLVLALVFIKFFLTRRTFSFHRGYLQVVEQLGVGSKASLVIVKVGEEYFLYGVTENQVEMISKLSDYVPSQDSGPGSQTFAHILTKFKKREEGRQ
ncbi:MAG: hypothetical protein APF76_05715 [Desulfitibacter sp. BRH_c19]|nr:MAG: hypothetical protein APF76_05715 [Desulfitibacter sp. BRH_c19]